MHPILLDDQSLFTEFEAFIEAVDNIHELALDGNQKFSVLSRLLEYLQQCFHYRSLSHQFQMTILSGCLCTILL